MKKLRFRGDTIIEVLISIAVVSAVLGGAYASANRSLNATRQAQERGESLKLAEEQLERLKSFAKLQPEIFTGDDFNNFCIVQNSDGSLGYKTYNVSDINALASYQDCGQQPQGGVTYYVLIQRLGSGTFVITSTWNQANGQGNDTLELVYRLYPASATSFAPPAPDSPGGLVSDPEVPKEDIPDPRIFAEPRTVTSGSKTTIRWTAKNADRCEATNQLGSYHKNWHGPLKDKEVRAGGGDERTNNITQNTYFYLRCWKGAISRMAQVRVKVTTPTSPSAPSNPANPPGPGGPPGVCGVSTYFAHPGPIGHGHDGEDAIGEDGGDGHGGDACTGDGGDGGRGGDSAPGRDGTPSAPSAPSSPSTTTGTTCQTKNGVKTCTSF